MERCPVTDLPATQCAHCVGDDGTPGLHFQPAPTPPSPPPVRDPGAPLIPAATQRAPRPRTFPALCVLGPACRPHDPDHPRPTDGRAWVCPACEDRARDALTGLVSVWPDLLDAITALPPPVHGGGGKPKGDPATGIRLNEQASNVRGDIARHAAFYAAKVRAGRGGEPSGLDTTALLGWVAQSGVPFLTAHPDRDVATCFALDTPELLRSARVAAYPPGTRTISIPGARCQTRPDDGTPGVCGGDLVARIRPDATTLPDLVCTNDPDHRIPPSVWRRHDWAARNLT